MLYNLKYAIFIWRSYLSKAVDKNDYSNRGVRLNSGPVKKAREF